MCSLIPNIVKLSRRSSQFFKTGFTPRSVQSTPPKTLLFLRSSPILLPNNTSQKALPSFGPFSNASRVNRRARHRQFPKCGGRGIARFKVERMVRRVFRIMVKEHWKTCSKRIWTRPRRKERTCRGGGRV